MHKCTMFSFSFLTAIFFLNLQFTVSSFQFPFVPKNVDSSFIGPAEKPHPRTKPNRFIIPETCSMCNCTSEYISHYAGLPQYIPSGSIFANVPSVTLYTNTLLQAIYSSDILRDVFDLSQTAAKQYVDFLTKYATHYLKSLCIEHAEEAVEFAFRGVEPNFDVLTLPIVARFYTNSAANFLYTDGFLRIHNAKDLALQYARVMTDRAKVSLNSDPTSKFQVLADGFVYYFRSIGLSTEEKVPFLAFYVGNEWFVAGVNYKWC